MSDEQQQVPVTNDEATNNNNNNNNNTQMLDDDDENELLGIPSTAGGTEQQQQLQQQQEEAPAQTTNDDGIANDDNAGGAASDSDKDESESDKDEDEQAPISNVNADGQEKSAEELAFEEEERRRRKAAKKEAKRAKKEAKRLKKEAKREAKRRDRHGADVNNTTKSRNSGYLRQTALETTTTVISESDRMKKALRELLKSKVEVDGSQLSKIATTLVESRFDQETVMSTLQDLTQIKVTATALAETGLGKAVGQFLEDTEGVPELEWVNDETRVLANSLLQFWYHACFTDAEREQLNTSAEEQLMVSSSNNSDSNNNAENNMVSNETVEQPVEVVATEEQTNSSDAIAPVAVAEQ